ncbi:MAG: hypothetical protein WAS21_23520 [Geminicoccaceae bacterium]
MQSSTRSGGAVLLAALILGTVSPASAQSSATGIVEEALQGVEADQARDAERVRRMVDEAVKGAEDAPSGQDAVNPAAPTELRPLAGDAIGVLPAGYQEGDLAGKPVRDGTTAQIGEIQAMAVDETSGAARAMVAFAPLFGQAAKVAAVQVEALVPAGDGFAIQLTPVQLERMPAYAWEHDVWRRVEG